MSLTCRYGAFEVKTDADLISVSLKKYGEWAQLEIDLLSNFISAGDTVVDAGAYIGTHSRAFSEIVGATGKVLAFEPSPETFNILSSNVTKARYQNIVVHPFGLGAIEEQRYIHVNEETNVGATRLLGVGELGNSTSISVRPLDSLHLANIRLIKADVEDMELQVLHGAVATINACQPIVFIEVNSLEVASGIFSWTRNFHYRAYGVVSAAFNAENFNNDSENIFGIANEVGLLLVPEKEIANYSSLIEQLLLPAIRTIDDLAILMLYKPQYASEILSDSDVVEKLGRGFSPDEFDAMRRRVTELESRVKQSEAAQRIAESIALERLDLIATANKRIMDTEQAKNFAEALAFERQNSLLELAQQLSRMEKAKELAERLAIERLNQLQNVHEQEQPSMAGSIATLRSGNQDNAFTALELEVERLRERCNILEQKLSKKVGTARSTGVSPPEET